MTTPYNPLDMDNLAFSIANAILDTEPTALAERLSGARFQGAGIYAIYFVGDFEPYRLLGEANMDDAWDAPIYVGKAIPPGGRKGGARTEGADPGLVAELTGPDRTTALANRLREHAISVNSARNLDINDFYCRWLVVERIWIPLGESLLINRYQPVWNRLIDGFGNHDPGSGRHAGQRTRWDVLHPGRPWSENLVPRTETAQAISDDAAEYLRQRLDP